MKPEKIGRYIVKSELGRGGMATVFLANDPLIGRDVAIKVLPREFLHDPSFRGRFEREARTIAMLEHPAIVPIYDFGEQDGQPYLVMRYMKGGTLGDRIKDQPLPVSEASAILERLGSALDHAHGRGVIHRDLKPGNILFDEYGRAFLSDFGIVKLAQATATFTGESIIGTPAYMSPEQVHGDKEIDGRSDIYTLGVILFEMLTGQMPYRADTPAKLMMAHVLNPVPRILDVRPDLPSDCNEIIGKSLAKDPDQRFATAGDLSAALADTIKGKPPVAKTAIEMPAEQATASAQGMVGRSTARPATQRDVPATPPPTAKDVADDSRPGRSRLLIGGVALIGALALCCAAIFVAPALFNTQGFLFGAEPTNTPAGATTESDSTSVAQATTEQVTTGQTTTEAGSGATAEAQAATSTAAAQEAAIATRVAESTVTAAARDAATATAYAPSREVEQAIQVVLQAQQNDPVYGPTEGSLEHISDGFVKANYAGVDLQDFVIEALFYNPYASSTGGWDVGYAFREADVNDQYRLAVESNGEWSLSNRLGEETTYVNSGTLSNLNTGTGGANRLTVYALDGLGYLFVNGQFVAQLDLSDRTQPGDIAVATSLFTGNEIEGEETAYEEFSIWSLN